MQSKPVSAALEAATSLRAEMAFAPLLDATLNVNRDELLMVPFWIREWVAGLISYQRTWAPAPPKTVCWVHSAVTDPCAGSMADTACVRRVSRVSSLNEVPG